VKEDYEGQGLERLFKILGVLAVVGGLSVVGWIGWGVWKWLS
jgi:hypothetical protein